MKFGVIVFPGSNCDDDMVHVLRTVLNQEIYEIWHKSTSLKQFSTSDCIVLPGGFSFGDYLRAGAIARFSPIMSAIIDFANQGGTVFGICNGFQILCETGLLPGVLLRNQNQRFISKSVYLRTENHDTALTFQIPKDKIISMPIAHAEGRYHIDNQGLSALYENDQILFTYCDHTGDKLPAEGINGSTRNIAGICNVQRNVFGMMPHPERASEDILGSDDGLYLFSSLASLSEILL